jgi:hypothetical protein
MLNTLQQFTILKHCNIPPYCTLLNTYNLVSVHVFTIDLTYYFFLNFLGDERNLLNAILFRQIHKNPVLASNIPGK